MIKGFVVFLLCCFFNASASEFRCIYDSVDFSKQLSQVSDVIRVTNKKLKVDKNREVPFFHYAVYDDNSFAVIEQKDCLISNLTISIYSGSEVSNSVKIDRLVSLLVTAPITKQYFNGINFKKEIIKHIRKNNHDLSINRSFSLNLTDHISADDVNSEIYLEYRPNDATFSVYKSVLTLYIAIGGHY